MIQEGPNMFSAHHSKTAISCKSPVRIILPNSELISCMSFTCDVVIVTVIGNWRTLLTADRLNKILIKQRNSFLFPSTRYSL